MLPWTQRGGPRAAPAFQKNPVLSGLLQLHLGAQPGVPVLQALSLGAGHLEDRQVLVEAARKGHCALHVKVHVGEQIHLVQHKGLGKIEEEGVFFRLVVAFGHGEDAHLGVLAQIEFRGADKVAHIFDEEDVDTIYSESFAMQGIGKAIMNRLEKAAGHMRISAAAIVKEQKYRRVIFVSRADSVRGPMAAELLRNQDLRQEYVIDSMGLVVLFPEPANQKAEAIMKSAQMTLEGHFSRQFDGEGLQDDTLVLTIDSNQKEKILSEYENLKNVYTLNEFVGDDTEIPDPYGKPLTAYGECYEVLDGLVRKLADRLNLDMERDG